MGEAGIPNWVRQLLLEIWAVLVMGTVVGFMGPFGTYAQEPIATRVAHWALLVVEAYAVVRPGIIGLNVLSRATGLPRGMCQFWGIWLCAAPVVLIWWMFGNEQVAVMADLALLLPTSLLFSVAILGLTRWAEGAERRLTRHMASRRDEAPGDLPLHTETPHRTTAPGLADRLSSGMEGPILALESEDHYVRVHTAQGSELLLMRLRDAIAEMAGNPGEQVHRSWWVAEEAIETVTTSGRNWMIRLTTGQEVPIARGSLDRLQKSGFLTSGNVSAPD